MTSYLLLGEDFLSKDKEITSLKKTTLKATEALKFDYEVLHAHKLDSETLKKALISLPALAPQRLVLIRECHRFSPHNKELILELMDDKDNTTVLILESEELEPKDSFVKKLGRKVKVMTFGKESKLSAFDLAKAISFRKKIEALKILSKLLEQDIHPLQIMGALVWSWGRSRGRIGHERFQQGLAVLQEADLNIKRSRLRPDYAMEVLVVQLCTL